METAEGPAPTRSVRPRREEGLEVGRLILARDDRDFDS
jgi:hypothetical protein